MKTTHTLLILLISIFIISCNKGEEKKEEQLTIAEYQSQTDLATEFPVNSSSVQNQFVSTSSSVLLTGIDRIRLIPFYKIKPKSNTDIDYEEGSTYSDYGDRDDEEFYKYFMPGIDIIYGYNLVNMGHYDIEKDTLSYFFENPVLIKTLYFPGLKKDSLNHKPVSRNYFLVSAYDEDTNRDSLINSKDLRKIYHIDLFNTKKTQLTPSGYSVTRSTYDYKNDIMYIYTKRDVNQNGTTDKNDPMAIFWIRLNEPTVVRKMMEK